MELPGDDIPPRILKLIELGLESGWHDLTTLVARFQKPSEPPFFASWRMTDGKWMFDAARILAPPDHPAVGLIKLGWPDIKHYFKNTSIIYPEDPDGNGS
jgi:hypothetical protein